MCSRVTDVILEADDAVGDGVNGRGVQTPTCAWNV
jgi:hypothetical protein